MSHVDVQQRFVLVVIGSQMPHAVIADAVSCLVQFHLAGQSCQIQQPLKSHY